MSISAETLRRLAALDLSKEAFQEVLSIIADMQAGHETRRQAARDRTAKWREGQDGKRHGDVTVTSPERHGDCHDPPSSLSPLPDSLLLTSTDAEEERKKEVSGSGGARDSKNPASWPPDAWEQFYGPYPNKVGKKPARRAFERIQQGGRVPWATLHAGLQRYLSKSDDRAWCNPATWLNEERWEDQPAVHQPRAGPANGHGAAPRPGSREDRQERLANVLQSIDPRARPQPDDTRSGESTAAPIAGLLPFGRRN